MKEYENDFTFNHEWSLVTGSLLQKYPNPFSSHVLGADVIDRWIDDVGRLHTVRLLIKTNPIPSWAAKLVNIDKIGYILEQSVVDPKFGVDGEVDGPRGQEMSVVTKNLTHTKFMDVTERLFVTASENYTTLMKTHATIVSNLTVPATPTGWLRNKVETFGLQRFEKNAAKSRNGLAHVLERVSVGEDQHDLQEEGGSDLMQRVRAQLKEKREAFKEKRQAFKERRELFKERMAVRVEHVKENFRSEKK